MSDANENLFKDSGAARAAQEGGGSALQKYQHLMVGESGWWPLLKYELITGFLGWLPGALGLFLRQQFYPLLFSTCGAKVVFGRNLTIRHPGRISLGKGVILCDDATVDAKGSHGNGITVGDGVFLGKGSVLSTVGGTLEIGEGCNIGTYCRVSTRAHTVLGKKVLIAAYAYIVGGDHASDRLDIPVIDQPAQDRGGVRVDDGAWLGTRVSVVDGVHIGENAIVGAHALVLHDIPAFHIAAGTPAKIIRDRRESTS